MSFRTGKFINKQQINDNWNELFGSVAKKEHIEAFKLRYLHNYTYQHIADTLGYANAASARRASLRAYERIISAQVDDVEKARIEAIARHKDLIHELYTELEDEHIEIETKDGSNETYVKKKSKKEKLATIDRIIKLEQNLARLEGTIRDEYNTAIQINNNSGNNINLSHEEALKLLE